MKVRYLKPAVLGALSTDGVAAAPVAATVRAKALSQREGQRPRRRASTATRKEPIAAV